MPFSGCQRLRLRPKERIHLSALSFSTVSRNSGSLRPAVVPDVKLQNVYGIFAKFFADFFCVIKNMLGGKNVAVFKFRRGGPDVVHGRNFGRGIKPAIFRVTKFVAVEDFAEQAVAFSVAVGPGGVEEIAAEVDGQLQGFEGFLVVRASPIAHAPEADGHVADLKTRSPERAIFHDLLVSLMCVLAPVRQGLVLCFL